MTRLLSLLAAIALMAGCAPKASGAEAASPPAASWRNVATAADRHRLGEWRKSWTEGLASARRAHAAEIGAEGLLLDPDTALPAAAPPPGDYRCRTLKVGARSEGMLDYVAYPAFSCRIGAAGADGSMTFEKRSGSQRPVGRLYPDRGRRMIFLGTLQLGDERGIRRYGHDRDRDLIAILERIGERRWRLVFPYPAFESLVDVIELVPAS